MKSQVMAASGVVPLLQLQDEVNKLHEHQGDNKEEHIQKAIEAKTNALLQGDNKEEHIQKAIEAKMNALLQSIWQINDQDIKSTLSQVCQSVLRDPSVSKDVLRARAAGLRKLGTIFQSATKPYTRGGNLRHCHDPAVKLDT